MEVIHTVVKTGQKPHVVCIPFPAQGHINPLLCFALLLHHRGFFITFVNTEYNQRRLLKAGGDCTQDPFALMKSIQTTCLEPFCGLLTELQSSTAADVPPVTSIISDLFMNFSHLAGERFGLPRLIFCTSSASLTLGAMDLKHLVEKGYFPLKDEDMETMMDWLPGLNKIRLRDYSSTTIDPQDTMIKNTLSDFEVVPKAKAMVVNTFHDLEREAIEALKT